jgi:hypothetical protein
MMQAFVLAHAGSLPTTAGSGVHFYRAALTPTRPLSADSRKAASPRFP